MTRKQNIGAWILKSLEANGGYMLEPDIQLDLRLSFGKCITGGSVGRYLRWLQNEGLIFGRKKTDDNSRYLREKRNSQP